MAPFFQVEEGCQQLRKSNRDDFIEKLLLSAEIIISFHSSSWQKINKGIGYPLGPAYRFPVGTALKYNIITRGEKRKENVEDVGGYGV